MDRKRIAITIHVDLDPVPGAFHTMEDAAERIEGMLHDRIGHYHPAVTHVKEVASEA